MDARTDRVAKDTANTSSLRGKGVFILLNMVSYHLFEVFYFIQLKLRYTLTPMGSRAHETEHRNSITETSYNRNIIIEIIKQHYINCRFIGGT